MPDIKIYHNPDCSTSSNVLAMIRSTGTEPEVIEYPVTRPSREKLKELIAQMGFGARDLLRRKGMPHDELQPGNPAPGDGDLIAAMLAHPILINRPIVVTPPRTRLCRPSETVFGILPLPQRAAFAKEDKEDGERVTDERGERVAAR
jgi:arsenate reductase